MKWWFIFLVAGITGLLTNLALLLDSHPIYWDRWIILLMIDIDALLFGLVLMYGTTRLLRIIIVIYLWNVAYCLWSWG